MRPSKICSKAVSCGSAMADATLPHRSKRPMLPAKSRPGQLDGSGQRPRRGRAVPRTDHEGPSRVDTSRDARQDADKVPAKSGRLRSLAVIVIFDVAAPVAAYALLRSAGLTAVEALLVSGVFPAAGVGIGALRNRRLDVIGALVLAGIGVGTVLGLVSHSARLLLVEGSVPTGVLGIACLGSLRARRPLMFIFALEFVGPDTAQGREMVQLWDYEGYRRVFRTITTVWGCGFVLEAALRVRGDLLGVDDWLWQLAEAKGRAHGRRRGHQASRSAAAVRIGYRARRLTFRPAGRDAAEAGCDGRARATRAADLDNLPSSWQSRDHRRPLRTAQVPPCRGGTRPVRQALAVCCSPCWASWCCRLTGRRGPPRSSLCSRGSGSRRRPRVRH